MESLYNFIKLREDLKKKQRGQNPAYLGNRRASDVLRNSGTDIDKIKCSLSRMAVPREQKAQRLRLSLESNRIPVLQMNEFTHVMVDLHINRKKSLVTHDDCQGSRFYNTLFPIRFHLSAPKDYT